MFGFPLVLMDLSKSLLVSQPGPDGRPIGVNRLDHRRRFPDASFTDVVSPNADTLYSMAWLDLSGEPMILDVPPSDGRYHLLPLLSAWTDVFASPGSRTTGGNGGTYAMVGPHGAGVELPAGVHEIGAPTSMAWMIGRIQADGPDDYGGAHQFQDGLRLSPLSAWLAGTAPARGDPAPPSPSPFAGAAATPVEQVAAMGGAEFFTRLSALMIANPPALADAPALERFARIGLRPGTFDPGLAPTDAVDEGVRAGFGGLQDFLSRPGELVNGWALRKDLGRYGTAYAKRAVVALAGLGANQDEDAVYPRAAVDGEGRPLSGEHRYRLRFEAGRLPPALAFWSLTMYNDRQSFVDNPLGRYAIGDRDRLVTNRDGSLDIYLQEHPPGEREAPNWLPAPASSFNVILRIYWPGDDVLIGAWVPPPIERLS